VIWLHPIWLWSLIPLFVGAVLAFRAARKREQVLELFARRGLWSRIIPLRDPERESSARVFWFLGMALILIALARPQWGRNEEVVQTSGLDIIIALDVSNSMAVEDAIPNRLAKAKHWIGSFLGQLGGDRVALIGFAGSSYVASPLTTDHDYVREVLGDLSPRSISNQGTDLDLALSTAVRLLDGGAEAVGPDAPTASSVVLMITDGEDHQGLAFQNASRLKEKGVTVFVLGVGTEQGGPIPVRDESGSLRGYKRDPQGKTVVSQFSGESLQRVAEAGGGQLLRLTDEETEIRELLAKIGKLDRRGLNEKKVVSYEERFQIPLALGLILLLIATGIRTRKPLETSGTIHRLALLWLGIFGGLASGGTLLLSHSASAAEGAPTAPVAPSVTSVIKNKQGIRALENQNSKEATELFTEAQIDSPEHPELQYNSGVAWLSEALQATASAQKSAGSPATSVGKKTQPAGSSEEDSGADPTKALKKGGAAAQRAGEVFKGAALHAQAVKRPDVEALAWFNRGVITGGMQQVPLAIESYVQAIEAAKKAGKSGEEVLQNARKNLELLLIQQQQQQQQQQKKKQDQDKKEQDQQQQESQSSSDTSDQEGQGKKDENSQSSSGSDEQKKEPQKPQAGSEESEEQAQQRKAKAFESKNLTEEDAEQVMNDLSLREKELRSKMQRQKTARPQSSEKDW